MIPKIIHYCWFGHNPLPNYAVGYIESWKKHFPSHEIKEWNENQYDVHKIPYISEAYNAGKYAFVSDYARFDILYEFGGIYFDIDVEVIRPFGSILDDTGFMGMEMAGRVAVGLGIGCNSGMKVVKEILEQYEKEYFLCSNKTQEYNLKTVVRRVTDILVEKGFNIKDSKIQRVSDFTIYPAEYFAPQSPVTYITNISANSVSIHHYWIGKEKDAIKWITDDTLKFKYFRKKYFEIFGDSMFWLILLKLFSGCRKVKMVIKKISKKLVLKEES